MLVVVVVFQWSHRVGGLGFLFFLEVRKRLQLFRSGRVPWGRRSRKLSWVLGSSLVFLFLVRCEIKRVFCVAFAFQGSSYRGRRGWGRRDGLGFGRVEVRIFVVKVTLVDLSYFNLNTARASRAIFILGGGGVDLDPCANVAQRR